MTVELGLTPDSRWDIDVTGLVSAAAGAGFSAVGIPGPRAGATAAAVLAGAVAVSEDDPEEAYRLAELALDQLARTWYATGMARVRAVRAALSPWESLPYVRRLDERLYDWNTTINALAG